MENLQENIIPSSNQNSKDVFIHGNPGFKVLFLGNSITKHSPKPEVGWTNDCGMAASSLEKDYVHVFMQKLRAVSPGASFAIAQVANFERGFLTHAPAEFFSAAQHYDPDVILGFYGANVDKNYSTECPKGSFAAATRGLLEFLNPAGRAKVFLSGGFYIRPELDAEKQALCAEKGYTYIDLGDIPHRKETHGKFNHPSDLGMAEIAEVFWQAVKPLLGKQ